MTTAHAIAVELLLAACIGSRVGFRSLQRRLEAAAHAAVYVDEYSVIFEEGPMDAATAHAQLGKAASGFLAGKHQLFIDGKSVDAKSGKKFDVFDPATGQAIAAVAEADTADVDQAVKAARRAFETGPWSKTSPQDRSKLIWKLADLLEKHADEIAELEALDNGKPIRDARNVDLPGSYEILRYIAGWATKINGATITVSAPGDWHAYTLREPLGVVGQIIPGIFR
jgi:phenylacetaldehyde dehydrogenase